MGKYDWPQYITKDWTSRGYLSFLNSMDYSSVYLFTHIIYNNFNFLILKGKREEPH